MSDFELPSNSGRVALRFTPRDILHGREEPLLVCDVRFDGDHWEVSDPRPIELLFSEVPLSVVSLKDAAVRLQAWVDLPLLKQKTTPLELELPLGSFVALRFGPSDDLTVGHQRVTVRICVGHFRLEVAFTTDPSCVGIFCAGVRGALA